MKNKKLIIVIGVVIILLAVSGVLLKSNFDRKNSIEYTVQLQNKAETDKDAVSVWNSMHPDDKLRWTEQEYITSFNNQAKSFLSIQTKSIKPLDQWLHPIIGKSYSDVLEVTNTYTLGGAESPKDVATYYAKANGHWYFFSSRLSNSDREHIKSEAKQGIEYKELSKNSNKYTGQKVVYVGKVIQIEEDEKGVGFIRLDIGQGNFSEDILYVHYTQSTDVLVDDTATVYGILGGSLTYISQANYNITIPYLEAGTVEKGNSLK